MRFYHSVVRHSCKSNSLGFQFLVWNVSDSVLEDVRSPDLKIPNFKSKTTQKVSVLWWCCLYLLPWKLDLGDVAVEFRLPSKAWIFPTQVKVVPGCCNIRWMYLVVAPFQGWKAIHVSGDRKSQRDRLEKSLIPDGQQLFVELQFNDIVDDHLQSNLATPGWE